MKAILLDGSWENGNTGERVRAALTAQLQAQGWDVEHIVLRERKIGNCAGDFFCWIRTPGLCNLNDDNRAIAEALVNSDLMADSRTVESGVLTAGRRLRQTVYHSCVQDVAGAGRQLKACVDSKHTA